MPQYAILRFAKHKGNPARPLEAHHERQKEKYASNPDIDTAKSKYNFHIVKPEGRYYHFIQSRIEQAGCRTRKDSTRFVDTLITASPEFFKGKTPKEIQAFFQRAADFLIQRVGRENIVSAVVHMDEKTSHLHLTFVPMTKDNRLCAKEILGNRASLTKWQDDFHAYMVEKYPDLERGESASKTGRKHIPTRLFKQAVSLSKQARTIEAELDGIGPLNAGKKKEEALSMLKKWFPQMENFSGQLKKYKVTIADLLEENKKLEARAKASEKGKLKDTMERAKYGKELIRPTLAQMLRNPVYVQADLDVYEFFKSQGTMLVNDAADFTGMNGCYLYQGRDVKPSKKNDLKDQMLVLAPHEGIVPSEIWLACRKKLMNNMKIQSARKATHTWLAGKIKCGNCGYALMSIVNRVGRQYLRCTKRLDNKSCIGCGKIYTNELETVVYQQMVKKLESHKTLTGRKKAAKANPKIAALQMELAHVDGEIERLVGQPDRGEQCPALLCEC